MTTPKKIANALRRVKTAADRHNAMIVMGRDMRRADRELLMQSGWLLRIVQGWYLLTRPDIHPGDSASWYANFWDFLRIYLQERFGTHYCLSAETSLELHIGSTLAPKQVIVIVKEGGTIQRLPFGTSVLIYADAKNLPPQTQKEALRELQVMSLPLALCKVSPTYYRKFSENIEIALRSLHDPTQLTQVIIENEYRSAAERIAGSYLFFDLKKKAQALQKNLAVAGMLVHPHNPFEKTTTQHISSRFRSPYAARIELMWHKFRKPIVALFPKKSELPKNPKEYLAQVNKLYVYDAYNSLSIEGYHVTEELIKRVQKKSWNPSANHEDAKQRDALAARGYYEAFQSVQTTLEAILKGKSPGACVESDLSIWYQNLFMPCVQAEIISRSALLGYRRDRVFIQV